MNCDLTRFLGPTTCAYRQADKSYLTYLVYLLFMSINDTWIIFLYKHIINIFLLHHKFYNIYIFLSFSFSLFLSLSRYRIAYMICIIYFPFPLFHQPYLTSSSVFTSPFPRKTYSHMSERKKKILFWGNLQSIEWTTALSITNDVLFPWQRYMFQIFPLL